MANHPGAGPLNIGQTLLKWEIRGLLGKGGHAWVYDGYDPFLDRHVAIKVIPAPSQTEPERDLRDRAQREARVLSRLENENIVRLIEAGFTGDSAVYIVMEMLRGRTWRDGLNAFGMLNVAEALLLGAKVADGVHAAHGVKVIHRDLKPENVFVIDNNGVKVLDFGIAKLFGPGAATTQRDLLHGTMKYMSPEHLMGKGVTVRSDIFALGTMLYEALCGRVPCEIGVHDPTRDSLIYAQLNRMPPLLDELVPSVPHYFARTIRRMIAKDPQDRFESMAEVSELLRGHAERYFVEANGAAPPPRELWRAIPPEADAPALSRAPTEINEISTLAPPTAPPVTLPTPQAQDTTPVSRPPFSERGTDAYRHLNTQVTEPIRFTSTQAKPLSFAPSAPVVEPQRAPAPAMMSSIEAPVPLSQAALRVPPIVAQAPLGAPSRRSPSAPNPPLSDERAHQVQSPNPYVAARPKALRPWKPLAVSLSFGAAIGLIIGLGMYGHRQPAATSTEEPITVISAQTAPIAAIPQPSPIAPAMAAEQALAVAQDVTASPSPTSTDVTATTEPAPHPAPPQPRLAAASNPPPAAAPKLLPAASIPAVQAARATAKPTPKTQASTTHGGLWDMSDLDTPTQPKTAPPAASKRSTKAIYGDDPVAR